jgi:DNA (cytosine-5)-methyltransferase 1
MAVYYNDNDLKVCAWLRELIKEGLIAEGDVDERSIADVKPSDLAGYTQCHFFAGIGGWSYALRLAGWPDGRPVWTGSCPCQPFSVAGKGRGESDERHLWPEFRRLIAECSPPVVFGEQVASKAGRGWLSRVRADLEALGYGVGAADLCAAGVGAPHIRQRLYWVADAKGGGVRQIAGRAGEGAGPLAVELACERCADGGLADSDGMGPLDDEQSSQRWKTEYATKYRINGVLGNSEGAGSCVNESEQERRASGGLVRPNTWAGAVLIPCADGKARRIEPSIEPLVDGLPSRVGLLRGYGNSIVPQVAQEFIESYMDINK